jgi:hypothetical protein
VEPFDAYPNSTRYYFPKEPNVQKVSQQQEVDQIVSQLPLLEDTMKNLNDRIEATDSVKQALQVAKKYEVSRENALVILDVVRQQLEIERDTILGKVELLRKKK